MRVADLSPVVLHAALAAVGAAAGLAAAWLADALPPRYDIVHVVTGPRRRRRYAVVVAIAIAIALGLAHTIAGFPEATLAKAALFFAINMTLSALVLAGAAVDVEHMILPNEITIGGAVLALAASPLRPLGLRASAMGAALGLLVAWVPSALYKRLRGKSGQGMGDAKLAVLAGAWHGFFGAFFVLVAGALQMVLAAVAMKALGLSYPVPESVRKDIEDLRAKAAAGDAEAQSILDDDPMANPDAGGSFLATGMPLGPFLALALFELLFFGGRILAAFDRFLAPG